MDKQMKKVCGDVENLDNPVVPIEAISRQENLGGTFL